MHSCRATDIQCFEQIHTMKLSIFLLSLPLEVVVCLSLLAGCVKVYVIRDDAPHFLLYIRPNASAQRMKELMTQDGLLQLAMLSAHAHP